MPTEHLLRAPADGKQRSQVESPMLSSSGICLIASTLAVPYTSQELTNSMECKKAAGALLLPSQWWAQGGEESIFSTVAAQTRDKELYNTRRHSLAKERMGSVSWKMKASLLGREERG